ncbi:MAG: high-potential iron-sulfur protein [Deltaproteobacteria bacterium]|nr:high-potential iron-sulfur protein [Deltaproteobacteria bacterium]MBW2360608.1 high-potential iron-sulfur protein [Deltaproteobacteria bacterium]
MQPESKREGATRRDVLRSGARLALTIPLAGVASSALLAGCGSDDEPAAGAPPPTPPPDPVPPPAPVELPAEPAAEPVPVADAGAAALVTDLPDVAAMVAALQYTNTSGNPDQRCANCQLFAQTGDGIGKCQIFAQGYVTEGGWCVSWAAKAS